MRKLNDKNYDRLIYEQSAKISAKVYSGKFSQDDVAAYIDGRGGDISEENTPLRAAWLEFQDAVNEADPVNADKDGRGLTYDEGVYEALKEIFRIVHDEEIYDGKE